jgi:hypothetical protein
VNCTFFLNVLRSPKIEFVICGDININNLTDSHRKQNLNLMLLSYNLSSTVNFPTRVPNNYSSAIDDVFIDKSKLKNYKEERLINGLYHYEAQLVEINDTGLQSHSQQYQTLRKIDKYMMAQFVTKLSYEAVFDSKFNCFLNTYFRIFYLNFSLIGSKMVLKIKPGLQ